MRCYSCRKYDGCERPWKCDGTMYDCSAYELEQTNEEWLKQCTTEQLARIIYELMWHKEKYPELCVYPVVDSVVEWLKQPHTVKE